MYKYLLIPVRTSHVQPILVYVHALTSSKKHLTNRVNNSYSSRVCFWLELRATASVDYESGDFTLIASFCII